MSPVVPHPWNWCAVSMSLSATCASSHLALCCSYMLHLSLQHYQRCVSSCAVWESSNFYRSRQHSCLCIAIISSINEWSFEGTQEDIHVDRLRKLVLHAGQHWWSQLCELQVLHMHRVRERGGCNGVGGSQVDSCLLSKLCVKHGSPSKKECQWQSSRNLNQKQTLDMSSYTLLSVKEMFITWARCFKFRQHGKAS